MIRLQIRQLFAASLFAGFMSSVNASAMFMDSQTQNNNVHFPNVLTFDFTSVPTPATAGTLLVTAFADLNSTSEFLALDLEGLFSTNLFVTGGLQQQQVMTSVALSLADLTSAAGDGTISFTVTPSSSVHNLGSNSLTLKLSYESAVPEPTTFLLLGLGLAGLGFARRKAH